MAVASAVLVKAVIKLLVILSTFVSLDAIEKSLRARNSERRRIKGTRCNYNFIIKHIDEDSCPTLLNSIGENKVSNPVLEGMQSEQPLMDGSKYNHASTFDELLKRVKSLEMKLNSEMAENRDLRIQVQEQQQWLGKTDKYLENNVKVNISTIFDELIALKKKSHKDKAYFKSIEHKLGSVMLDVAEVNNYLADERYKVQDTKPAKIITVVNAPETQGCSFDPNATIAQDCDDHYDNGHRDNGVYYIKPLYSSCSIPVFCDMETPEGGWTIFQRRVDGNQSFNHTWDIYRKGFGDINHEYWLGNDNLFLLTNQAEYRLRIDLWDFFGSRVYAVYTQFSVAGERDKYRLTAANHSGTAPDGLSHHHGIYFSTPDQDNDAWSDYHCGKMWGAGWWFNNCWFVLLNGQYYNSTGVKYRGMSWNDWKSEQLSRVEMKMQKVR